MLNKNDAPLTVVDGKILVGSDGVRFWLTERQLREFIAATEAELEKLREYLEYLREHRGAK